MKSIQAIERGKKRWEDISIEKRKALMSALGKARWAKVSPEERKKMCVEWAKRPRPRTKKDI